MLGPFAVSTFILTVNVHSKTEKYMKINIYYYEQTADNKFNISLITRIINKDILSRLQI